MMNDPQGFSDFFVPRNHQSVMYVSAILYPYVNYVDEFISHKTFGFVEGKSHRISQSLPDLFVLCLQLSFQTERRYLGMVAIFSRSTSSTNLVFFWDVHPPGMWYFLGFLAPQKCMNCMNRLNFGLGGAQENPAGEAPLNGFPNIWGCDIHKKWGELTMVHQENRELVDLIMIYLRSRINAPHSGDLTVCYMENG